MNQPRSEQKKLTLKQSENNPSVMSTLPYIAQLADGEFSLHCLSAGDIMVVSGQTAEVYLTA